jgi:lipoprotein-anchoring transpeptidase ErfK/SrfK
MNNATLKLPGWGVRIGAIAVAIAILSFIPGNGKSPAPSAVPNEQPVAEKTRISFTDGKTAQSRLAQAQNPKIRSILNVEKPLHYGEFIWNDAGVPAGKIWIRVDLSTQILSVFRGGHEIGTAVIMYGADEKPTPTGTFSVLWKKEDHQSSLYDAPMPYTLRLTNDGISIHGADVRFRAATHGCVSIPDAFAKLLFSQTKVGDEVTVLPEKRISPELHSKAPSLL